MKTVLKSSAKRTLISLGLTAAAAAAAAAAATDAAIQRKHCVKSVQIRSYVMPVFSYIRTDYRDLCIILDLLLHHYLTNFEPQKYYHKPNRKDENP